MNGNGIVICNGLTGNEFTIATDPSSRSLYKFNCALRGLERMALEQGLDVFFITTTLKSEELERTNKDLNRFRTWMRMRLNRAGSDFGYVWVVELQKRRFQRLGQLALHWHWAVVCGRGALPDIVEKTEGGRPTKIIEGNVIAFEEMERFWGYGFIWSVLAHTTMRPYLGKYFGKDYEKMEGWNSTWSGLRRWGSSQLREFGLPVWAFEGVQCWKAKGVEFRYEKKGGRLFIWVKGEYGGCIVAEEFRSPYHLPFGPGKVVKNSSPPSGTEDLPP